MPKEATSLRMSAEFKPASGDDHHTTVKIDEAGVSITLWERDMGEGGFPLFTWHQMATVDIPQSGGNDTAFRLFGALALKPELVTAIATGNTSEVKVSTLERLRAERDEAVTLLQQVYDHPLASHNDTDWLVRAGSMLNRKYEHTKSGA